MSKPIRQKRSRNPHVNNTLAKVIDSLRASGQPLTLSEIEQRTKLNLRHPEDLIVIMRDNPKILWDPAIDRYSLRNKYEIKDKHELLDHMRRTPDGLPNNQDLWDCYKGVEKDVEELKRQGRVRCVRNEEKKVDVMFYRNAEDPVEHYARDLSLQEWVKDLWKAVRVENMPRHSDTR